MELLVAPLDIKSSINPSNVFKTTGQQIKRFPFILSLSEETIMRHITTHRGIPDLLVWFLLYSLLHTSATQKVAEASPTQAA